MRSTAGQLNKKVDDRQKRPGLQTRTPPTYVITELQTNLDLRNTILPENKPNGPVSYGCKFPLVFSLPVSSNVRFRVLYRRTIGAGTRVRLGFPNARPVVSDERSEEFRRSVKESLNGPVQENRSDGTKPGIGIERKNKPTINMKKRSIGKRGNYKLLSVHFIKLAGTSVNSSCRISFASIFPSGPTKIM